MIGRLAHGTNDKSSPHGLDVAEAEELAPAATATAPAAAHDGDGTPSRWDLVVRHGVQFVQRRLPYTDLDDIESEGESDCSWDGDTFDMAYDDTLKANSKDAKVKTTAEKLEDSMDDQAFMEADPHVPTTAVSSDDPSTSTPSSSSWTTTSSTSRAMNARFATVGDRRLLRRRRRLELLEASRGTLLYSTELEEHRLGYCLIDTDAMPEEFKRRNERQRHVEFVTDDDNTTTNDGDDPVEMVEPMSDLNDGGHKRKNSAEGDNTQDDEGIFAEGSLSIEVQDIPDQAGPLIADVLCLVFVFLNYEKSSLMAISQVCRMWRHYSNFLPRWSILALRFYDEQDRLTVLTGTGWDTMYLPQVPKLRGTLPNVGLHPEPVVVDSGDWTDYTDSDVEGETSEENELRKRQQRQREARKKESGYDENPAVVDLVAVKKHAKNIFSARGESLLRKDFDQVFRNTRFGAISPMDILIGETRDQIFDKFRQHAANYKSDAPERHLRRTFALLFHHILPIIVTSIFLFAHWSLAAIAIGPGSTTDGGLGAILFFLFIGLLLVELALIQVVWDPDTEDSEERLRNKMGPVLYLFVTTFILVIPAGLLSARYTSVEKIIDSGTRDLTHDLGFHDRSTIRSYYTLSNTVEDGGDTPYLNCDVRLSKDIYEGFVYLDTPMLAKQNTSESTGIASEWNFFQTNTPLFRPATDKDWHLSTSESTTEKDINPSSVLATLSWGWQDHVHCREGNFTCFLLLEHSGSESESYHGVPTELLSTDALKLIVDDWKNNRSSGTPAPEDDDEHDDRQASIPDLTQSELEDFRHDAPTLCSIAKQNGTLFPKVMALILHPSSLENALARVQEDEDHPVQMQDLLGALPDSNERFTEDLRSRLHYRTTFKTAYYNAELMAEGDEGWWKSSALWQLHQIPLVDLVHNGAEIDFRATYDSQMEGKWGLIWALVAVQGVALLINLHSFYAILSDSVEATKLSSLRRSPFRSDERWDETGQQTDGCGHMITVIIWSIALNPLTILGLGIACIVSKEQNPVLMCNTVSGIVMTSVGSTLLVVSCAMCIFDD